MLKKFNFHSLQTKIFLISILITSVTLFINAFVIIQCAAKIISEDAYDYIYESMRHAASNFDILLEDAFSLSITIASNKDIIINALLDNSQPASYEAFERQKKADNYLENLVSNKSHILLASVVGLGGKSYKSSGTLILKSVVNEPWFTETSMESAVRLFYNMPDKKRIALCRPIRYSGQLLGVAMVEMDYEVLADVYSVTPLQDAKIFTFTEDGSIVFSNIDSNGAQNIAGTPLENIMEEYTDNRNTYYIDGQRVLAAKYTSSLSKLTTIGLVAYDDLLTEALSLRTQSVTMIAASFIAATLVAWLFARYICKNIYRLQSSMKAISRGNLSIRSDIDSKDEIGVMAGIFNKMMNRITSLMQNIREKEEQKRQAEQNVLEAQIQPHFLYNTINSISYVAHMKGEKEIEDVSIATVELLRGVMGIRESFIPLWQECEYIKQYIKIQEFKMQKQFSVSWDVEPELWIYKIPKLLIQPIVENSLVHGIYEMENGRIGIQVSLRGDNVLIRVTDNGKGMSQNTLDMLNRDTAGYSQFRSVGFANVKDRIKAIYGDTYDVNISSVKGAFTSVEIVLPYSDMVDGGNRESGGLSEGLKKIVQSHDC